MSSDLEGMFLSTSAFSRRNRWGASNSCSFLTWSGEGERVKIKDSSYWDTLYPTMCACGWPGPLWKYLETLPGNLPMSCAANTYTLTKCKCNVGSDNCEVVMVMVMMMMVVMVMMVATRRDNKEKEEEERRQGLLKAIWIEEVKEMKQFFKVVLQRSSSQQQFVGNVVLT